MTIGTGSKTSVAYVAETVYGQTPASPVFQNICNTGCTFGIDRNTIEAACLNDSRQRKDVRGGNSTVGGDLNTQLEYASFDDLIEAVMMGAWATDVLKAGVNQRSFTFERYFDLATDEWHRYRGMVANSMSLSVQPDNFIETAFNFIGQSLDSANLTSQEVGATYTDETGNEPFDSFSGTINEGGNPIAVVTQLDMTIENGINPAFVIGSRQTIEPFNGQSIVNGTLTAYFEDSSLLAKYLNDTNSSIDFTLTDPAGNSYTLSMPNIKYTSGRNDVSGPEAITVPLGFSAIYDGAEDSQLVWTRVSA